MSQTNREILERELRAVFENNDKTCPEFSPDTPLDSSFGLDSLDWAEFAVRFQKATGRDIFMESRGGLKKYSDLLNLLG